MKKINTLCVVGLAGVMLAGGALAQAQDMPVPILKTAPCPTDAKLQSIAKETANIVRPEIGMFNGKWSTVSKVKFGGGPIETIYMIKHYPWVIKEGISTIQKHVGHTYKNLYCQYTSPKTSGVVELQKFDLIK